MWKATGYIVELLMKRLLHWGEEASSLLGSRRLSSGSIQNLADSTLQVGPARHAVLDDSPEIIPVLLVVCVLIQDAENPVGQVLEVAPVEVETKQISTVNLTISPLRGIISPADVPR
jgi:hypothetical protein